MTTQETPPTLAEKVLKSLDEQAVERVEARREARRLQQLRNARNYADNEKSDPFAFARAITHINNGISDPDRGYEAEKVRTTIHLPEGEHFSDGTDAFEGVRYNNIKRP